MTKAPEPQKPPKDASKPERPKPPINIEIKENQDINKRIQK